MYNFFSLHSNENDDIFVIYFGTVAAVLFVVWLHYYRRITVVFLSKFRGADILFLRRNTIRLEPKGTTVHDTCTTNDSGTFRRNGNNIHVIFIILKNF